MCSPAAQANESYVIESPSIETCAKLHTYRDNFVCKTAGGRTVDLQGTAYDTGGAGFGFGPDNAVSGGSGNSTAAGGGGEQLYMGMEASAMVLALPPKLFHIIAVFVFGESWADIGFSIGKETKHLVGEDEASCKKIVREFNEILGGTLRVDPRWTSGRGSGL